MLIFGEERGTRAELRQHNSLVISMQNVNIMGFPVFSTCSKSNPFFFVYNPTTMKSIFHNIHKKRHLYFLKKHVKSGNNIIIYCGMYVQNANINPFWYSTQKKHILYSSPRVSMLTWQETVEHRDINAFFGLKTVVNKKKAVNLGMFSAMHTTFQHA